MIRKSSVRATWFAVAKTRVRADVAVLSKYFHVQTNNKLAAQFDMPSDSQITPEHLTPSDGFHVLSTRAALGQSSGFKRTPYPALELLPGCNGVISSISADVFPGDILIARISADVDVPMGLDLPAALRKVAGLRSPRGLAVVDSLFQSCIALAQARRPDRPGPVGYSSYFGIRVQLPVEPEGLDVLVDGHRDDITSLLVGAPDTSRISAELVEAVFQQNADLNVKARSELLLLNGQGILNFLPSGEYTGPHRNRFERTMDLGLMALYARAVLRVHRTADTPTDLVRPLERWIDHPRTTFDASYSQTLTWAAFSEAFHLEDMLGGWRAANRSYVSGS